MFLGSISSAYGAHHEAAEPSGHKNPQDHEGHKGHEPAESSE